MLLVLEKMFKLKKKKITIWCLCISIIFLLLFLREWCIYYNILKAQKTMWMDFYDNNKPIECKNISVVDGNNHIQFLVPLSNIQSRDIRRGNTGNTRNFESSTGSTLFKLYSSLFLLNDNINDDDDDNDNEISDNNGNKPFKNLVPLLQGTKTDVCLQYYITYQSIIVSPIDVLTLIVIKSLVGITSIVDIIGNSVLIPFVKTINALSFLKTMLCVFITKYIGYILNGVRKLTELFYNRYKNYRSKNYRSKQPPIDDFDNDDDDDDGVSTANYLLYPEVINRSPSKTDI